MMDAGETNAFLDAAAEIAEQAGPIALRHFRSTLDVEDKSQGGFFDPVTVADKEVEAFIRKELAARFPEHGVIGEEEGTTGATDGLCWIIDPIDGTRAFISGVPAWGILLGLMDRGKPLAGVMHQPYLGETFGGTGDTSHFTRNGERQTLHVRKTISLEDAVLYCTHPTMFKTQDERNAFRRVAARSRLMRYGGDCYAYCLLAMGHIDLVIEGSLQPYDILPLIPIVEGAGGIVTTWTGDAVTGGGLVVAAATRELHTQALNVLHTDS